MEFRGLLRTIYIHMVVLHSRHGSNGRNNEITRENNDRAKCLLSGQCRSF